MRDANARLALTGIALLEALNYAVNVVLRPEPWNAASVATGYALWAVQAACFVRLQLGDPGSAPAEWDALAADGSEQADLCTRTGRLVPMRARYCRRAGAVVLGLDHYCHWLGTPVGFGNRKLFILFVGYSAIFCAMGCAHSVHELLWATPARLDMPSLPAALRSLSSAEELTSRCQCVDEVACVGMRATLLSGIDRGWSWLLRLLEQDGGVGWGERVQLRTGEISQERVVCGVYMYVSLLKNDRRCCIMMCECC